MLLLLLLLLQQKMKDGLEKTRQKDSLGNDNEKFHGLYSHFIVFIQGHGDHAILDRKLHKNTHARAIKNFRLHVDT